MTKDAFQKLLDGIGLSPGAAAALLGTSVRTIYRYLDGSRPIPGPVLAYLWLYSQLDDDFRAHLRKAKGLK